MPCFVFQDNPNVTLLRSTGNSAPPSLEVVIVRELVGHPIFRPTSARVGVLGPGGRGVQVHIAGAASHSYIAHIGESYQNFLSTC